MAKKIKEEAKKVEKKVKKVAKKVVEEAKPVVKKVVKETAKVVSAKAKKKVADKISTLPSEEPKKLSIFRRILRFLGF